MNIKYILKTVVLVQHLLTFLIYSFVQNIMLYWYNVSVITILIHSPIHTSQFTAVRIRKFKINNKTRNMQHIAVDKMCFLSNHTYKASFLRIKF